MPVIPFRSEPGNAPPPNTDAELRRLLLGDDGGGVPLPAVSDVLSALIALAEGRRSKSVLPLGTAAAELVLARRGSRVLVSYVVLEGAPALCALDRPVPLALALSRCAAIAKRAAEREADPIARALTQKQAARALEVTIAPSVNEAAPVRKSGGAIERPGPRVPLAFAFDAEIVPQGDDARSSTSSSDMHALLFRGAVSMWARGRRVSLVRGPIMLAIVRMVAAARALVEAREASRPANVRLRAGSFVVGVRLERDGMVSLRIGPDDESAIIIPELTVEETALPILRLASDVLRALVSVDRTQARNLRVSALKNEVRALRRRTKASPAPVQSILFDDPDRLRAASAPAPAPAPLALATPRSLRFERRWEAEVEGLDAASTFLCGDRLVVATPRSTVALGRDDGRVLWASREPAVASFMTGTVLVRVRADGRVALCDLRDGEPYAEPVLAPRVGGPPAGLLAGGGSIPPVAILAEGRDRLTAIDLRTGDLRWRTVVTGPGAFELKRAGRVLLVTRGDGTMCALDVANGELLWRFVRKGAGFGQPAVDGDVVVAASSDGTLFGIDLFSGEARWDRELEAAPSSAPLPGGGVTTIAIGGPRRATLAAFTAADGTLRWMIPDPGAALGASCLSVDRMLIVNAPGGVSAIGVDDGQTRWKRRLSHPVADDVPRRLEAVLRGGALFVPSAEVHVLRPQDGTSIGEALPCELVPDWMRVDERGWVYVAEESGHLRGLAPRPHLSLVR